MGSHNSAAATDYGAPATNRGSSKMHRLLLLANHILHFISSLIVMSIAAYLIAHFRHNVHMRYWVSLAAIDLLFFLPALVVPALKSYKGYLAPLDWIFSYLWLTAFIFAAQDYSGGRCHRNSPFYVDKCALKKTLEAFAFLAFLTSLIGTLLEGRLWDVNRNKHPVVVDKHPVAVVPPPTTTPYTAV
ncbi:hypothetical protein BDW02DRAFT_421349 [Decorospora gaudefroyi]|uniref:MARVEL domain-containing protein n=1 Tax=Decorospora gaudefroyi TaxID=184978 RepID=A0A6A5K8J4_9PLEO|nr:hypothetical protein BDW02DRAFT_421349 [Decorospora gaudefroyi]